MLISPASLRFALRLLELGGRVRVPTTLNALSVDTRLWRKLQVPDQVGMPASALGETLCYRRRMGVGGGGGNYAPRRARCGAWLAAECMPFPSERNGCRRPSPCHTRHSGIFTDRPPNTFTGDAYVRLGARPTFTCAPYLLDSAPKAGESPSQTQQPSEESVGAGAVP
jgi:hypothetical protein